MDGVHERTLMVRLEALDVEAVRRAGVFGELFDVGQGGGAVFLGFTGAEQIQVGSVEDQDCVFGKQSQPPISCLL
jgi:hypothetical protein